MPLNDFLSGLGDLARRSAGVAAMAAAFIAPSGAMAACDPGAVKLVTKGMLAASLLPQLAVGRDRSPPNARGETLTLWRFDPEVAFVDNKWMIYAIVYAEGGARTTPVAGVVWVKEGVLESANWGPHFRRGADGVTMTVEEPGLRRACRGPLAATLDNRGVLTFDGVRIGQITSVGR